jgi:hypothetical protein
MEIAKLHMNRPKKFPVSISTTKGVEKINNEMISNNQPVRRFLSFTIVWSGDIVLSLLMVI